MSEKTITRDELWKRCGPDRWYGQGQTHDITRWEEDRDLVEATACALGYTVTDEPEVEPDPEPEVELPEGWTITDCERPPSAYSDWKGVTIPGANNRGFWIVGECVPDLARALEALREPEGDVIEGPFHPGFDSTELRKALAESNRTIVSISALDDLCWHAGYTLEFDELSTPVFRLKDSSPPAELMVPLRVALHAVRLDGDRGHYERLPRDLEISAVRARRVR